MGEIHYGKDGYGDDGHARHEHSKNKKFKDGNRHKLSDPICCADCGNPISNREDNQNEGLCDGCYDEAMKVRRE